MIPYVTLPALRIFGVTLQPFTALVIAGMVLCFFAGQRRVRAVGLYAPLSAVALLWIAIGGFAGAHVLDVLLYTPERLRQNPYSLLSIWQGISSFGGFIGGSIAFYLYCRRQGIWMLAYLDALMFGFAPGWILARSGCVIAHDHLGWRSDFFLAVAYPTGARHNLALYEALLALAITIILYALPKRERFVGFYSALVMLIYAPARFFFDTMRTGDRRIVGLTPAQHLCFVMAAIAVYLIVCRERPHEPAANDTDAD